jgi:CDP-2,3-bis-(O-geranylgeranyl)-sn-glycerol synthase
MLHDIGLAIWFFLPAGIANVAPVLAAAVPGLDKWNAPIDGGRQFRGRPLLGPHKTWRGLAAGILLATLAFLLQQMLVSDFDWAQWLAEGVPYASLPAWLLGPLFALGALGGDAVESFFKRRRGLESGAAWLGFDQLDYIIGAIILTLPVVRLEIIQYLWAVVVWLAIHLASSYIGWLMGLKKQPI